MEEVEITSKLITVEARTKKNAYQIDEVKKSINNIHEMTTNTSLKIEQMKEDIDELKEKIERSRSGTQRKMEGK